MAYVSRYVCKKAFQPMVLHDCEPEFSLMSRRPGLGKYFYDEHRDELGENCKYFATPNGSVKVNIPQYYLDKLKVDNPDLYDKISKDRKRFANDKELSMLQNTDLDYFDQLKVDYEKLLNRTSVSRNVRDTFGSLN